MTRWQYAWMTDQPATTIGFSHPQPGLAMELGAVLGPGVYVQSSTEWSVSLDRTRVNLGYVSGLLGDRGWEMFAVETRLQPGAMSPAQLQTNWYFKREAPDVSGSSAQQMPSSAAAPTGPQSAPAGFSAAPGAFQAAPAPATAAPAPAPAPDPAPADPTSGFPAPPAGPGTPTG